MVYKSNPENVVWLLNSSFNFLNRKGQIVVLDQVLLIPEKCPKVSVNVVLPSRAMDGASSFRQSDFNGVHPSLKVVIQGG